MLCSCLQGALLSPSLSAKRWMPLNPRDIRWRDTLRRHYHCRGSHHHPPAKRRLAQWLWKATKQIVLTAFSLQENSDDHGKKTKKKQAQNQNRSREKATDEGVPQKSKMVIKTRGRQTIKDVKAKPSWSF